MTGQETPNKPITLLKNFLESDADIYCQHYTIDDNKFLTKEFVANLKKEYAGTVYYDRYILGRWVNAEGLIYTKFADNPDQYVFDYQETEDGNNLPKGKNCNRNRLRWN